MYRDVFTNFVRDLSKFNPNELIIVTYDKSKHTLIFMQLNQVIMTPYLSPFFLPKRGFKIGVLTQSGYNKLMYNLNNLLGNTLLDKDELVPDLKELGIDWFRLFYDSRVPFPQKFISLKFVNVTNKFLTWLLCKYYNNNSRIIYSIVSKERKIESGKPNKSNKP